MNRLRGGVAVAIVLVIGIAVPLTVVKGTQFSWRHTPAALWAVAVVLLLIWLVTAAPIRARVPIEVARRDRVAPLPGPPASRRGAEAHEQAVALREALDDFIAVILESLRRIDANPHAVPVDGEMWAMRDECQVATQRLASAYHPLKDLFIEFVVEDSASDLRRRWSNSPEDIAIDYPRRGGGGP